MGRLVKELHYGEGIQLVFGGKTIKVKLKQSGFATNAAKLVIEADPEVIITGLTGTHRQDG